MSEETALLQEPPKRGPGRPRKYPLEGTAELANELRQSRDESIIGLKLLPSPPVGTVVQWFKCGDKRHPCPATVLANDGNEPGHLDLSICIGSGWLRQPNVTWSGDPEYSNPLLPQVRNNGTWDKLPQYKFTEIDYEVHEQLLLRQERAKEQAAQELEQRKREYEETLASGPDPRAVQVARLQAEMIMNSAG